ncbi:DUF6745 domain-containing protein [Actinomadura sp. 9N407]|uniref:DUF6745 domain-containing protein n=1 Tax=Actinomadura sp. 9N407 TaxID=3375154 RepID=UPI0037883FDA
MTARADIVLGWQAAAFASGPTGPEERERAEAGVRTAYAAAGLAAPEQIVWVPSPVYGAFAAALIGGHREALEGADLGEYVEPVLALFDPGEAGASVRDAVRTVAWERTRTAIAEELGPELWARTWAETGGRLWGPVSDLVARIRQGIGDLAGDDFPTSSLLRAATLDAVLGQHDAPFLSLADTLGRLDGAPAGMAAVARAAGWWWPYERIAIVSERPLDLHRDEPGRLHRGDGPALGYADGFALHAWRGMPMPAGFIASLTDLSLERIRAEENAEQRRVMLEIYGYDRYLAESGATPRQRDSTGVLWQIDMPGDEPILMVEVVNSTPEPDGTSRTYYLRVPPTTQTARQGVAWTFGLEARDYQPERQT